MNASPGVVDEGAEGDGDRIVVVVQKAEEDKNKRGEIWDLFEHNGVFGRRMEGTWAAVAGLGECAVRVGLNLMNGLPKGKGRERRTLWR